MPRRAWGPSDENLREHLVKVVSQYAEAGLVMDDGALTEYVRYCRRSRWTYRQIGEALGISATRASKLHKAWQAGYGA